MANAGVGKREWDADKVRKVLEGKAVVRVVDVESLPSAAVSTSATAVSLGLGAPSIKKEEGAVQVPTAVGAGLAGVGVSAEKRHGKSVCFSALEEKLKNLHL